MRIYFAGLGGVAIGPLAEIALDAGFDVAGSDMQENLMSSQLQNRGVSLYIGEPSDAFLRSQHQTAPFDWFVHTAALPPDHLELVAAQELGIRIAKRDELLAHIIAEKNLQLIAISGTHGKTTTTGMLVWTLQQLGVPVSYSIGTTLSWGPSGKFDPASKYFVYECDEFDRNFLHFHPHLAIITNVDYDHPDTYPTLEDYQAAFRQFEEQSRTAITEPDSSPSLQLAGAHNRHNGGLVLRAIRELSLDGDSAHVITILNAFPGLHRRFEKLADNLYSDYGHHPVEIAATLQMARELSRNVVLVYQPHQNVRQHEIKAAYTDCMQLAEEIYWLPTYLSREDATLEVLNPAQLTENLVNKDAVHFYELGDELWHEIQRHMSAGHLVLCMGAGSIDAWVRSKL